MNNHITTIEEKQRLRLPELQNIRNMGTNFIQRAVSITLLLLFILFAVTLIGTFVIKIDVTVDGNGTLEPTRIWPIHSQESGVITDILVVTGDTVFKGQTIATLDSLNLKSSLIQLESELAMKQIEYQRAKFTGIIEKRQQVNLLAQAEARLIRTKAVLREKLANFGFSINSDSLLNAYLVGEHIGVDIVLSEVKVAEADLRLQLAKNELLNLNELDMQKRKEEIERLKAQIQIMKKRLNRLKIVSPISGIILTEQIEYLVGTYVREGDLLLEISDMNQWQAAILIKEQDVHKIHIGDSVKVEVQAFRFMDGYDLLAARVISIAPEPFTNAKTPLTYSPIYRIKAILENEQIENIGRNNLRCGYSVQGKIVTKSGRIIKLLWNYFKEKSNINF